ncbi:MAG: hypothetical protein JST00_35025 [Deltaproteobacteria bacterium]|nr:hypothetical protein [Deltaproteobacteria bacterium]
MRWAPFAALSLACASCSLLTSLDGLSGGGGSSGGSGDAGSVDGDAAATTDGAEASTNPDATTTEGGPEIARSLVVAGGTIAVDGGGVGTEVSLSLRLEDASATWRTGANLPFPEELFMSIVGHRERVYAFFPASVISSTINSGGTLGSWTAESAPPGDQDGRCVAKSGDFAYVLGGRVNGTLSTTVNVSRLTTSALSWATTTPLPLSDGRNLHGCAGSSSFVFLVGGKDSTGTHRDEVFVAKRDAAGALGAWATTTKLPSPVYWPRAVATATHLYVLGGAFDTLDANAVLYAPIGADGNLGAWVVGTGLPARVERHGVVATDSALFVAGGLSLAGANPPTAGVYTSTIGASGAPGPWAPLSSLPVARASLGLSLVEGP